MCVVCAFVCCVQGRESVHALRCVLVMGYFYLPCPDITTSPVESLQCHSSHSWHAVNLCLLVLREQMWVQWLFCHKH